jgi:hypothetical protein
MTTAANSRLPYRITIRRIRAMPPQVATVTPTIIASRHESWTSVSASQAGVIMPPGDRLVMR